MGEFNRRDLLKLSSGVASLLFPAIAKALSIPAENRAGTIEDVEHIVILMQENRSFDHYFGSMAGVRGFADQHPAPTPQGSVWMQPNPSGRTQPPFHFDVEGTNFPVMKSLPHDFETGDMAWNNGCYDRWIAAKGPLTMGYLARNDIPYHFALADAFTVCDAYHSSLRGPTCPNRFYLMTGGIDHQGRGGGPVVDCTNITQRPDGVVFGRSWTTYPERLQRAGVSWQVYRQGDDPNSDDDSDGGMNVLLAFEQFRNAPVGDPLYERGVRPRTLELLKQDVLANRLAQVSWIVPPRLFCEHPKWPPAYGVEYIARVLDALTSNPGVWAKTVFLVMYDENDGFFDHIVPPTPPLTNGEGASTVATADECHPDDSRPYGLGMRVPMTVISPWSKGGWVCSELFDHTSVIRFMEARFGVHEPNISAWRRCVCGDLTSAFDFRRPNRQLPDTSLKIDAARALYTDAEFQAYKAECALRPRPQATYSADLPAAEPGRKHARALPYRLRIDEIPDRDDLHLRIRNEGRAGIALTIYDRRDTSRIPYRYTIGAGEDLTAILPSGGGPFDYLVHGPNGFVRVYKTSDPAHAPHVHIDEDREALAIKLKLTGTAKNPMTLDLVDDRGKTKSKRYLDRGAGIALRVDAVGYDGWYDFTLVGNGFMRRYAGRIESGRPGLSDPGLLNADPDPAG